MSSAKPASKRTVKRKINMSQPSEILKSKQKMKVKALVEEEKRQAAVRKQDANFLKQYVLQLNNNNNSPTRIIAAIRALMKKNVQKRKTRRLRR